MRSWEQCTDTWQQLWLLQSGCCTKVWMQAALIEILGYSSDFVDRKNHNRAFMNKSHLLCFGLPVLLDEVKDSPCNVLVDALLEKIWYITLDTSRLLYFQTLVDALLNLLALWNVEGLWTSATCSTWGKLKKPSSSAWKIVRFGLPCMMG